MKNPNISFKSWQYKLGNDWLVVVGKTDIDNDIISTEIVDDHEFWFHVASMPGSHAILSNPDNTLEPTMDLIKSAATIAAWHSKARNAKKTVVHVCKGRYVTKPKGAKDGLVNISNFKSVTVYLKDPKEIVVQD